MVEQVLNEKLNLLYSHHLIKPIIQLTEKPILQQPQNIVQPKTASKFHFQKVLDLMINLFQYPIM